jgi:hypothetical protein
MYVVGFPWVIAALPKKRVKRNTFTREEDAQLVEIMTSSPPLSWQEVAEFLPGRSPRQCRERWGEYLNPEIRVEPWTDEEDELLLRQVEASGHRWTVIAMAFANRSANDVKNRWYSHVSNCVVWAGPGRLEFLRDVNGSRIQGKLKRRRKPSFANRTALEAVQSKRTSEADGALAGARVWLPQLCIPDCERLVVEQQALAK